MTECQKVHADLLIAIERVLANGNMDSEIAFVDVSLIASLHFAYERYLHTPPVPMVD